MLAILLILIVVSLTIPMSSTAKTILNIALWVVLVLWLVFGGWQGLPHLSWGS